MADFIADDPNAPSLSILPVFAKLCGEFPGEKTATMRTINTSSRPRISCLAGIVTLLAALPVTADDTSVFFANLTANQKPNVLFVLDYSGSMAEDIDGKEPVVTGKQAKIDLLKKAVNTILDTYSTQINVGIGSIYSNQPSGVTWPISDLQADAHSIDPTIPAGQFTARDIISKQLESTNADGYTATVNAMADAAMYFKGSAVSPGGTTFPTPIQSECQANAVVLISDGQPTILHDDATLRTVIGKEANQCEDLSNRIFGTDVGSFTEGNCGLEIVKELATTAQNTSISDSFVKTFTVGFSVDGTGRDYLELLGNAGFGGYSNAAVEGELEVALDNILEGLTRRTESFTELTIDVNKATFSHDNRAFMPLFTPSSKPHWNGNLKGYFIDTQGLLDTNNQPAVVKTTSGTRFAPNAQSFWSDKPDGDIVEAGGASENLASRTRTLYTYTADSIPKTGVNLASGTANLLSKTNDQLTDTLLGLSSAPGSERDTLLDWISKAPMGAPLHSKPVTVNYGNRQVVYAMTNQGFLHAFDASNPTDPAAGDHSGGEEIFAFMPKELLSNIKPIKDNTKGGVIYGLDGGMTRWHEDDNNDGVVNNGEKLMLVFGMRRGGTNYYAMDLSNPDSPRLSWQINQDTAGFEQLAQSWSRMSLINVKHGSSARRVLVFGGGYDAAKLDGTATSTASKGNVIFMVDGSGSLIWSTDVSPNGNMQYAIPADITVIDSDGNGFADRMYAGDLGGQIWRIDFDDVANVSDFGITRLADLSNGGYQPFFYAPSVALISGPSKDFLSVSIGSGDRTQPLHVAGKNAFFMIRDEDVGVGRPSSGAATVTVTELFDATSNSIGSSDSTAANAARTELQSRRGWYVSLAAGEKSLSSVVTFEGKLLATTFQPAIHSGTGNCDFSPIGKFYLMDINTAQPENNFDDSGSSDNILTASDRARRINSTSIPSTPIIVYPKNSSSVQVIVDREVVNLLEQRLSRVYWHAK